MHRKTQLATALAIKTYHAGHRVEFANAVDWVTCLVAAHPTGRFPEELKRLSQIPLPIIDDIGYLPFEPEAANLLFRLISARYERASVIVTSNEPFSCWRVVFGDDTVAVSMIDRFGYYAEIIATRGDSYRLKDRGLGRTPSANKTE